MKKQLIYLFFLFTGCGLFSPGDVATPSKLLESDPFSWKSIPVKSGSSIFRFSYFTDILSEDFIYENQTQQHQRQDMVTRLNIIINNYSNINVSWEITDSTKSDPSFETDGEIELIERSYRIVVESSLWQSIYTGKANFTLKPDSLNDYWLIKRWRDINDSGGISFFNPNYN